MKDTVLVIGLGLIGGSLALSLKQRSDIKVIGYDHDSNSAQLALQQGGVDEICFDITTCIHQVDTVILATPISTTIAYMKKIDEIPLDHDLLITDVSSVKGNVMKAGERIQNPRLHFVGGHPMAGSHKQGFIAAKPHLFENAIYVLTPSLKVDHAYIEQLKTLLEPTKARFLVFTTEEHDEMTGVVSHFPHLIASSLVHQARVWQKTHPYLEELAAGGFRDITRIASSNPQLWKDIFFQNRPQLLSMLSDWIKEMEHVKQLLEEQNSEATYAYLQEAKLYRDGLPVRRKGAIPSFYDIYVDITDQPGALLTVIGHLADYDISIKNIQILEIREGITGVLRISFQTSGEQKKSKRILESFRYEVGIED
ncbi:prephenate dehydrogenase [Thalassobacillus sp. CUG 92003]|uniref:prephenate dehydrogenase n=1 Tax=Thalassobacillus sp. CUG 92003 TaxID=2736641 RepID=UPI0015E71DD9|nr:prephenate dehydrogenase [Thalassobacillus sp. CUG 92003]